MDKKRLVRKSVSFYSISQLYRFIDNGEGKAYYKDVNGSLFPCTAYRDDDYNACVLGGDFTLNDDDLNSVVGYVDPTRNTNNPETIKVGKHTYLILPDDTLIAMLFVGEVSIYWLTDTKAILVDDPKTIYGGCPHCFGIKVD